MTQISISTMSFAEGDPKVFRDSESSLYGIDHHLGAEPLSLSNLRSTQPWHAPDGHSANASQPLVMPVRAIFWTR